MPRNLPLLIALACLVPAGCGDSELFKPKKPAPPEPRPQPAPVVDPLTADTLGAVGTLSDLAPLRVRGFSLVVGLGENGSSDCPSVVREYLVDTLSKFYGTSLGPEGKRFSPGRLIDSPDSAVVEVVGVIRAGAPKGDPFDVRVEALAGTDTRTLEGGLLLPCELRLYEASASGQAMLSGKVYARAQGPVFVNPYAQTGGDAATGDPRSGFVLGGGVASEARPARLVFREPSYTIARRLENRINERFGQNPRSAEGLSKGYVQLNTPPQYAGHPERFHQLVISLIADDSPSFVERKLADLAHMASEPNADLPRIALMWEAIGRTAVQRIQPMYDSAEPALAYHAARAGLRLRDVNALPVLAQMASAPRHPFRLQAVRELGDCDMPQIVPRLQALLDADDDEVRIAAYEGLRKHRAAAVRSRLIVHPLDPAQVNVTLDVVNCSGRPLVYVRRTGAPRIAVFGPQMPVLTPVLYTNERLGVTINSPEPTDELTLSVRERYDRRINDRMYLRARVPELVAALAQPPDRDDANRLRGAGLTYSQIVSVLSSLDQQQTLAGRLVLEQTSLTELLGPTDEPARPLGDERTTEMDSGAHSPPAELPSESRPEGDRAVEPN